MTSTKRSPSLVSFTPGWRTGYWKQGIGSRRLERTSEGSRLQRRGEGHAGLCKATARAQDLGDRTKGTGFWRQTGDWHWGTPPPCSTAPNVDETFRPTRGAGWISQKGKAYEMFRPAQPGRSAQGAVRLGGGRRGSEQGEGGRIRNLGNPSLGSCWLTQVEGGLDTARMGPLRAQAEPCSRIAGAGGHPPVVPR